MLMIRRIYIIYINRKEGWKIQSMKRGMEENGKGKGEEKKEFSFWQVVFLVFADSRIRYVTRKSRGLSKGKGV